MVQNDKDLVSLQAYVAEKAVERGFDKESVAQKFMLLSEEIGELARAARKTAGIKTDAGMANPDLAEEAADVLFVLLNICNKLDIDLAQAFAAKELKNEKRTWQ